ncbi:MAG: peptidoglycan DD-metalloendopeptidase family protein [Cyclobacteriaceae bacterium]
MDNPYFPIFLALFFLVMSLPSMGQITRNRDQLEKEKLTIQKRLREFDTILKQTTAEKRNTLSELRAVNQKLEVRNSYINTLRREVNLINAEIRETDLKIKTKEKELNTLKEEYATMIYTSYKLNQGINILTFIFTSSTFRQFYMRLKYLKQYSDARKKQAVQIEKVSEELAQQRIILENRGQEKQLVLTQEQEQKKELDLLKSQQQVIVNSLSQKEEEVKKEIAETKKQQEELNKLIKRVIEEEIQLANAAANKEEATPTEKSASDIPLTPSSAAISSSFAGNRGNIPWPVETGFISRKYGTFPHPTLKGITETNDGVDIQTNNNEPVRSVFDGVVTKITTVPGMGGTIIIKHGEFYTMYSRLKTISVKSGEQVSEKSIIGTVYTDRNGVSELHFQTWKGLEVMDPSIWLSSK